MNIKPVTSAQYILGMMTAILTMLFAYTYCFADRSTTSIVTDMNIGLNLVTLVIFRKYLLRFQNIPLITSMDWFLSINAVIFLSDIFKIWLHYSGNPEFREMLEVMNYFDFFVYCTFLTTGILLGVRLRRLPDDTGLLKLLGTVFIALVPGLFLFVSFFIQDGPFKKILLLHIALTTVAQAPILLLIAIFYKAMKRQATVLA